MDMVNKKSPEGRDQPRTICFLQITWGYFGFGRPRSLECAAAGIPGPGSGLAACRRCSSCGHIWDCRDPSWGGIDSPVWQVSGDSRMGHRSILCVNLPRQYLAVCQSD